MTFFAEQKQRHRRREQMYGYQGGKGEGGMNWEIGIDTYTLLIVCIKQTIEGNICIAQGTLLNALWCPKWEGNPKAMGYMYMYG